MSGDRIEECTFYRTDAFVNRLGDLFCNRTVFISCLFFQQRLIILDTTEGQITQKKAWQSDTQKKVEQYPSTFVY